MNRLFIQFLGITMMILGLCSHLPAAELTGNVTDLIRGQELEITSDEPGTVRFTVDGSTPTMNSRVYNESLQFNRATVITAQLFSEGVAISPLFVRTVALPESVNLQIVSLRIDPNDFTGPETGIYSNPNERGKKWERRANIEVFSNGTPKLLTTSGAGLRIHGGASRKRGAKKSLRLYFKEKYGNDMFTYPIFGVREAYKRLILRAGFNDSWNYDRDRGRNGQKRTATYISDQVARDLHQEMGQRVSRGRFVVVYINGKYFGLYNIVHRLDQYFMAPDPEQKDSATVIASDELKGESDASWNELGEFVRSSYRDSSFMNELEKRVDVDSFISYMFLNIWLQNYDWPKHNWITGQSAPDAPWKFYIWDAEYAFGSGMQGYKTNQNTYRSAQSSSGSLGPIFKYALKNKKFKNKFKNRARKYMNNNLQASHIKAKFDKYAAQIRPYMAKEAQTWAPNMSVSVWERALKLAKEFCDKRTRYVQSFIKDSWF